MKIAYINKGKIKAKSTTDQMLERAYLRDIRRSWTKNKVELGQLGISETEYVTIAKRKLYLKLGIFSR